MEVSRNTEPELRSELASYSRERLVQLLSFFRWPPGEDDEVAEMRNLLIRVRNPPYFTSTFPETPQYIRSLQGPQSRDVIRIASRFTVDQLPVDINASLRLLRLFRYVPNTELFLYSLFSTYSDEEIQKLARINGRPQFTDRAVAVDDIVTTRARIPYDMEYYRGVLGRAPPPVLEAYLNQVIPNFGLKLPPVPTLENKMRVILYFRFVIEPNDFSGAKLKGFISRLSDRSLYSDTILSNILRGIGDREKPERPRAEMVRRLAIQFYNPLYNPRFLRYRLREESITKLREYLVERQDQIAGPRYYTPDRVSTYPDKHSLVERLVMLEYLPGRLPYVPDLTTLLESTAQIQNELEISEAEAEVEGEAEGEIEDRPASEAGTELQVPPRPGVVSPSDIPSATLLRPRQNVSLRRSPQPRVSTSGAPGIPGIIPPAPTDIIIRRGPSPPPIPSGFRGMIPLTALAAQTQFPTTVAEPRELRLPAPVVSEEGGQVINIESEAGNIEPIDFTKLTESGGYTMKQLQAFGKQRRLAEYARKNKIKLGGKSQYIAALRLYEGQEG